MGAYFFIITYGELYSFKQKIRANNSDFLQSIITE